jgi:hypothetical protein
MNGEGGGEPRVETGEKVIVLPPPNWSKAEPQRCMWVVGVVIDFSFESELCALFCTLCFRLCSL